MNFLDRRKVVEVDLHKFDIAKASRYLMQFVESVPEDVDEIIVIHGYHSGTALKNWVRNEFKSKKVINKFLSLNQGITTLILNSGNSNG